MSSFPHITELYLANNKIKQIEPNPNINRLDVHNNTISEFPENLLDLVMLNMGTNNISHLPNNSILGNNLIQLSLSQNHLTYIPVMCFKKLKSLTNLDLSGNEISSFSFGTFDNLENLLYLNISDNKFKVLPIYALHSVNNLVSLSFSDNDLTDLNVDDLLKHLPSLSRVDFRGNKLPCQQLLEAVQKLNMHHAVFEKGTHVETDNIYGMQCNVDDVKDKTKLKLLPEDFMNSSFVRYLESLNGVPSTENQRILEKLLDMDKKQIEVLEKIFNKLDKSQVEILQKSLENHNTDILKQLEDTVSNTKTINDNYEELKNVLRSILATDNKRNELLDELVIEQSNKSYQKNSVSMVEQFISILNKSYERQNETYSNLSIEMKNAMEALGRTQMNLGYFIEKLVKENQTGNNLNLSFAEEGIINANRAEALQSYPMDNSSDRKYPIFVFIALLLLAMTILMSVLLYVLYYRVKYVINTKQDVELNQLLGSKSDIVSN
ncbi:unnamed protein product [Acanthoscelides obtectus]|uniref:Uncharacterized protein n=1 Tax=Acanthoscelides obtectus TaxID=200917 RepID=A0A9P0LNI1_ACAOB|nr:unnamed protein product [Acanthoscelides obtectus]CAK1675503.1 Leucine-rich repeat-containing G-protein coupled receptor 4 [Acanthoscelides obtectus]